MRNCISNMNRVTSKLPSAARCFVGYYFSIKTKNCLSFAQWSSGSSVLIKSIKANVIDSIKQDRI